MKTSYYNVNKLTVSHSSINKYNGCNRKFELYKLFEAGRCAETRHSDSGRLMHHLYGQYLVDGDREAAYFGILKGLPYYWDKGCFDKRSLESHYMTLQALMDMKIPDGWELCRLPNEDGILVPAIEVPFQINLLDCDIVNYDTMSLVPVAYVGIIDFVFYNHNDQEVVVVDLKSTTINHANNYNTYYYDEQLTPYALILAKFLSSSMNLADSVSKGFSTEIWCAKMGIDDAKVERLKYRRTVEDVCTWQAGLLDRLQTINNQYMRKYFPRNAQECTKWGRSCEYFAMCDIEDKTLLEAGLSTATKEANAVAGLVVGANQAFRPLITCDVFLKESLFESGALSGSARYFNEDYKDEIENEQHEE